MANRARILASLLLVVAACGDDGGGGTDAGGDGNNVTCASATKQISAYPGTVDGTVVGGGADLTAAETTCTDTQDFYEPKGEDVVVALTNLTVGKKYGITLSSDDDLSMYMTSDCPTTGTVTGCSLFVDTGFVGDGEVAGFTATAPTQYLVVDNSEIIAVDTGAFTVAVKEATCVADTDCQAATPYCIDFDCHECASAFDCTGATVPVCDDTGTCAAGPMTCTGDDTSDTTGNGDDGPAAATMIAAPTAVTPTVVSGHSICNSPASEADWYKVNLTAANIGVTLAFTGAANDLDVFVLNAAGQVVGRGIEEGAVNEAFITDGVSAAGMYYVVVTQYKPDANVAAVPYTLTLSVPSCNPATFRSCTTPTAPVCAGAGTCGAGPAQCVGDTDGEGNDDGPAGGRPLVSGVALTGQICTTPATELDYYQFTAIAGGGETISLAWADTTKDLDLYVVDSTGKAYGQSFYKNPEVVTLTQLPAGTYYVRVVDFVAQGGTPSTVVTPYTITGTTTVPVGCTTSDSCDNEYKTQFYRGSCAPATGVCSSITNTAAAANGTACDSNNDCTSQRCSYIPFESDASKSICTPASCVNDTTCTAVNVDLRCTTGLQTNLCEPKCTTDLECGANAGSSMIDAGQPWNYLTCTPATGACSP